MNLGNAKRSYFSFNPEVGYPAAVNIFYECLGCGGVLPSLPTDSVHCKCRNIMIDTDYGRVAVTDHSKVRCFTVAT